MAETRSDSLKVCCTHAQGGTAEAEAATSACALQGLMQHGTWRYSRLLPPPRCQTVMRPWLLRPPDLRSPSVSGLYGPPFHSPSRSVTTRPRNPASPHRRLLMQAPAGVAARARPCATTQQSATNRATHQAWWACTPSRLPSLSCSAAEPAAVEGLRAEAWSGISIEDLGLEAAQFCTGLAGVPLRRCAAGQAATWPASALQTGAPERQQLVQLGSTKR